MEVIVHPLVDDDLVSHIEYYSREAGAEIAISFYEEFLRCLGVIEVRSKGFPMYTPRLRRINFDRFPYHILFEVLDESTVHVVVVKHDSRDPDLGLDR